MKKLTILFILILGITMISCNSLQDSYSYEEITTLVAIEKAAETTDSLYVTGDFITPQKYPIIRIEDIGYYPGCSYDGFLRYYKVK